MERVCTVWTTLGFSPPQGACAFLVYNAQASGCSEGELYKVGPELRARPRSKLLRFRFLDTPQRHRLSWACVLCPSQVRAAQVTRCLVSTHSPGAMCLITSPVPAAWFPGCAAAPQVCYVSLLISGCNPLDGCQPSRIPGRLG